MDKILVADIGVEGGGITIFGGQAEGVWSFWTEGTTIDLDENDHEIWRSWSSQPVSALELVLPRDWPIFYPSTIHPDFVEWFRANYDRSRGTLPDGQRRYQNEHRHGRWSELLGLSR